jgi:hypothetical protein
MTPFCNSIGGDKLVLIEPSPSEERGRDNKEGEHNACRNSQSAPTAVILLGHSRALVT